MEENQFLAVRRESDDIEIREEVDWGFMKLEIISYSKFHITSGISILSSA